LTAASIAPTPVYFGSTPTAAQARTVASRSMPSASARSPAMTARHWQ
jgi:hypothetical protein